MSFRSRQTSRRALPPDFGGFTPKSVGGGTLALWLRSDLGITLNGSNVSAWADQSGNGNNATNGAAAQQPPYTASDAAFNGLPSLQFTGDAVNPSVLFCVTNVDAPNGSTIFVVGNLVTDLADYVTTVRIKQYAALQRSSATDKIGIFFDVDSMSSTTPSATKRVIEYVVRAANDADIVINGSSQTVSSGTAYRANGQSSIGYGGGGLDTAAAVKKFVEVIVYTSVLSISARWLVRRYLGARYNIAVTP